MVGAFVLLISALAARAACALELQPLYGSAGDPANPCAGLVRGSERYFCGTTAIFKDQILVSWSGGSVSRSDPPGAWHAGNTLPGHCGIPWANDLLSHHSVQTRRRFDTNFHGDFCVARNGYWSLNSSGIIVAMQDASQPVMVRGVATPRGPPGSGHQSPHLPDNTLDRPIQSFCTAPLLSEFHLHDSVPVYNATRAFIRSFFVHGTGALLGIFSSNSTQPFTSSSYYEVKM